MFHFVRAFEAVKVWGFEVVGFVSLGVVCLCVAR